jgi:hypothetical protein
MAKELQRRTTAGLGVVAGAGAALLFSLGNAPLAGAAPDDALNDLLNASTNQFTAFSNNLTDNLQASAAGDNAIFGDYLTGLGNPDVNNTAALNGLSEVSTQLNTQLAGTNGSDLAGFNDVLGADNHLVFGFPPAGFNGEVAAVATALHNVGFVNSDFQGGVTAASQDIVNSGLLSDGTITGPEASTALDGGFFASGHAGDFSLVAGALNGADLTPFNPTPVIPTDPALSDALGAQTTQFTAFSNNLTDNLLAAGNGDAGIYTNYIGALANGVNNGAALGGLDEVSGQINDQLANTNAFDISGFDSVLDQDFTNIGDFLNPGDFLG